MRTQLKNGVITQDPRLDRVPEFDEQSRQYPIRELVGSARPRSYTWRVPTWLDQGVDGACVGFAWAHELAARPKEVKNLTNKKAHEIYKRAQLLDAWPGENYEGTSVLAGAKAVVESGHIEEYRWAFGIEDLIRAVGHAGPAVIGVNWYSGMMEPAEDDYIRPTGYLVGGHAVLVHGVNLKGKYFKIHNSWGKKWGVDGQCFMTFDDMNKLLEEAGEACIPVIRNT